MKQFTEQDYDKLQATLKFAEQKLDLTAGSLRNRKADRENVLVWYHGMHEDHPDFWFRMYSESATAAGDRLRELGININN
jgi:hypothetical protein